MICGDMNFCFKNKKHPWIQEFLNRDFRQLVTQPTHIAGGHIDMHPQIAPGNIYSFLMKRS